MHLFQALKLYAEGDVIELLPTSNSTIDVFINENIKLNPIKEDYEHGRTNETAPSFRYYTKMYTISFKI